MQRLKTRPQFQATMAGETVARTAHFALHRLVLGARECAPASERPGAQALFSGPDIWLGAMVPKRWARRAVTRNAIKRQIYGVAAALEPTLPPAAHVVRLRATFDRKQFVSASSDPLKQAVRAELQQLFERALGARKPASAPGAA
ncbi:MAG: ribonuclease P protein component [Burkholderiaceae bacterium]|nr:ribonuclease P protein component [Burkholderiaceae bacterium]